MEFLRADMLTTDLSDVGVLVLTNQCWDSALMEQVAAKVERELPPNAVVLEYTGELQTQWHGGRRLLRPLCDPIATPVSWNGAQSMHAYVVVVAGEAAAAARESSEKDDEKGGEAASANT